MLVVLIQFWIPLVTSTICVAWFSDNGTWQQDILPTILVCLFVCFCSDTVHDIHLLSSTYNLCWLCKNTSIVRHVFQMCLQGLGISKHNYVASEHLGSGGAGYVLNKISVCQLVLSSFPTQSSSKSTNNCPIEMGIWLNRIQNDCQCHHG